MEKESFKKTILDEYEKGNIVFATPEGLRVVNLEEFVKQPIEGLLYDLNRLPEVVLTFLDDPKWVNDYAVAAVISKLKQKAAAQTKITAQQTTSPTTAALLEDCLRIIKNIPWSCSHAANKERDNIVERLNGLLKSNGEKQPTA